MIINKWEWRVGKEELKWEWRKWDYKSNCTMWWEIMSLRILHGLCRLAGSWSWHAPSRLGASWLHGSLQPHLWVHWKLCMNCRVGLENEFSSVWHVEQRSSCLPIKNNNCGCKCDTKPNPSIWFRTITEMAWGNLLKGMNVHLIHKGSPTSCKVDNLWIYFLSEVERGSTDAKGVPNGCTPTMGFENGVNVHHSSSLDYGTNVTLIVSPWEQGVIWSSWDKVWQVLEHLDWVKVTLRNYENRLNFTWFGHLGRRQIQSSIVLVV